MFGAKDDVNVSLYKRLWHNGRCIMCNGNESLIVKFKILSLFYKLFETCNSILNLKSGAMAMSPLQGSALTAFDI